jgi:hypothetical protein
MWIARPRLRPSPRHLALGGLQQQQQHHYDLLMRPAYVWCLILRRLLACSLCQLPQHPCHWSVLASLARTGLSVRCHRPRRIASMEELRSATSGTAMATIAPSATLWTASAPWRHVPLVQVAGNTAVAVITAPVLTRVRPAPLVCATHRASEYQQLKGALR